MHSCGSCSSLNYCCWSLCYSPCFWTLASRAGHAVSLCPGSGTLLLSPTRPRSAHAWASSRSVWTDCLGLQGKRLLVLEPGEEQPGFELPGRLSPAMFFASFSRFAWNEEYQLVASFFGTNKE